MSYLIERWKSDLQLHGAAHTFPTRSTSKGNNMSAITTTNSAQGIVPTMIDAAAKASINTYPLRRNISVLEGSGGNIGVLTGKDGKLLVDSGFSVSKPRIVEALNNLSSDPIAQLLNTHCHTDHTDGNAWVQAAGAKITAHVNTKKHLSTPTRVERLELDVPSCFRRGCPPATYI